MTWVIKSILLIILAAAAWAFRFFYLDWNNTRKSEAYEDITPFEKLRFNGVFTIVFMALATLAVFLVYLILSRITITFELW